MLASRNQHGCITVTIEGFSVQVFPNGSCVTTSGRDPVWCHNTVSMKDFLKKNKENMMNISAVSSRLSLLNSIIGFSDDDIKEIEILTGVSMDSDESVVESVDDLLIALSNREISIGEFREVLREILDSDTDEDLFLG